MTEIDRRKLIKMAAAGMGGIATSGLFGGAVLGDIIHPHESSLKELDKNEYISRFKFHTNIDVHGGKTQMMSIGPRRFLFVARTVIEVTNPLKPVIIKRNAYQGSQIQVAYNEKAGKWIMIANASAPLTLATNERRLGKYQDPFIIPRNMVAPGLRGVRIYDVSDPFDIKLLSEWSCDQGDPKRPVQTGGGTHRNTYDGGKYAYLCAAPDNNFIHMEGPDFVYSWAVQILDVEDPENPKFVSNWWFPGQRADEVEAYNLWREAGDRKSFTSNHGPMYALQRVEDGGRYCHIAYGAFGAVTLDVSNPAKPSLVSRWRPPYAPSGIPVHSIWPAWLEERDLLLTSYEPFHADCYEAFIHNYVLDMKDIQEPREIAQFGRWTPPPNAPYTDFCDARGRMGTHNPPHMKAPGKAHPTWVPWAAFNAGLQAVDFTDPTKPVGDGYYIPRNPGDYVRHGESVFVEWDRGLLWFGSAAGMSLLSHPALGEPIFEPMPIKEWALASANKGAPS